MEQTLETFARLRVPKAAERKNENRRANDKIDNIDIHLGEKSRGEELEVPLPKMI